MTRGTRAVVALLLWTGAPAAAHAQRRVLDAGTHHLRSGARPEWSDPGAHPHARHLALEFRAEPNETEWTLALRQEDVKQRWRVLVNGRAVGTLHQDENAIVAYFPVPPGALAAGPNRLRIEPADSLADDVRVGRVELVDRPLADVLAEASVVVEVVDAERGTPLPARVTVADAAGRLQTVGAATGTSPDGALAVRPGFVYTGSGRAAFGLPAGTYRLFATRGVEYGVDSARLTVRAGDRVTRRLAIRREVPTPGWVGSDTHVHTLTHSGHGDATAWERALTLAGEGVELPIAAEHNVQVDFDSVARAAGVRDWFTPVVGNEVTTRVGHFNVFPLRAGAPPPDAQVTSWEAAFRGIEGAGARDAVVILNHARDVHAGFRPFGPERHIAVAGVDREGWVLRANGMEIVNSGAQQSDVWQLLGDWFGMLNRGYALAPVGASDSHDVGRYLVGQARTFIRADDGEPGRIDVGQVVERFRAGAAMASFGLLAEITVAESYGPGDLAPATASGDSVPVRVRVLGPGWTRADRVSLYADGRLVRTARIPDAAGRSAGVKWSGTWRLPRPAHDVHLVAVAEGPGERLPFWPIAKPYQPTSPAWSPRVMGVSGAVWVDADGDGARTPAHAYAARLVAASGAGGAGAGGAALGALVRALAPYDEAVAAQAAALLLDAGVRPTDAGLLAALRGAAPATRRGFAAFAAEWRASEGARADAGRRVGPR